jgi:tetratricopeptide (TPR) repeat protein
VAMAALCSRTREWHPVAFGLWWFLLAMVPTSMYPLAEVENDHRMYFPFVGLVLAASWPLALWIYRQEAPRKIFTRGIAVVCCFEFAVLALGTVQRNLVWHNDESLWHDVVIKSPHNARGLMNYAITLFQKNDPGQALVLLKQAQIRAPDYAVLEVNLGSAYRALKQATEAEEHFRRGLQLDPGSAAGHYAYALWLEESGRQPEAIEHLLLSAKMNPDFLSSIYLLMEIYAKRGSWQTVKNLADYIIKRFPSENQAKAYYLMAASSMPGRAGANEALKSLKTPESLLNLSALYYTAGRFDSSIAAARESLTLRPNYPEAYNNISAAYRSLGKWDLAIEASRQSLALRPKFASAQQNLAKAEESKKKAVP